MVLFILIDAFGWDWIKRTNFLDDITVYKTPVRTILGYSSGAMPSLLTGKTPDQHGHWNLFYLSPETSPFRWMKYIKLINNAKVFGNRYIREVARRISKLKSGYNGTFSFPFIPFEKVGMSPGDYLSCFDICEKRWLYNTGSIDNDENIFDFFSKHGILFNIYTYDRLNDEGIVKEVSAHIEQNRYQFYFLYFTELDGLLHSHIDEPDVIMKKIEWYGDEISRLYSLARKNYQNCSLIVCSDHGMAKVNNSVDLIAEMKRVNLTFGEDYIAIYDSTMARFWPFYEGAKTLIWDHLRGLGFGRVLSNDELKQLGIFFKDRRYGEIIFVVNEGYIIHPGMMGAWRPKGMHGYHPDCSSSNAIFMSNWEPQNKPESITDVFNIVKNLYREDDI